MEYHSGKVRFHPCQKPVDVLEQIITTHSNKGETVLDCFRGSGSTGQAAKNPNRNFIGFELNYTYLKKFRKLCIRASVNYTDALLIFSKIHY